MSFFEKLKQGLTRTKEAITGKVNEVFSNFRKVDEDLLEELEEILIMSDIGVETATEIISKLRNRIKLEKITDEQGTEQEVSEDEKALQVNFDGEGTVRIKVIIDGSTKKTVDMNLNSETTKNIP